MRLRAVSRGFFAVVVVALGVNIGFLVAIGQAFHASQQAAQRRDAAMALVQKLSQETRLLGRLVRSYIATADTRYLMLYYDILAVRAGEKPPPDGDALLYWEHVMAGRRAHALSTVLPARSLVAQVRQHDFGAEEQQAVQAVLAATEALKKTEQIAFAATQGLYDVQAGEFTSEHRPEPEFARLRIYSRDYETLSTRLADAVSVLDRQTDARTAAEVAAAGARLGRFVDAAMVVDLLMVLAVLGALVGVQRRVLRPIDHLAGVARAYAQGEYRTRTALGTQRMAEIDALAHTLDRMAESIEHDIAARERNQRDLEAARRQAEAATQAKSMFLANMSHEIRTPMNAIMGMTALAADRATDPVQLDYLTTVRESSDSLLSLLNDILDLSKVEAGKVDLEPVDFALSECLQGVIATLRLRAEEKNLRLICRIDDGVPPYLKGDERRLRQILLNLVGNAIKFTEAGQVQVRARMTVATPEPDRVRLAFAVLDTGVGVPEGQQRLIFAPFEQGDGSISRAYGGTGLGLAISSRLVQLMQGSLWVESPWTDDDRQRVAGSAFHFTAEFNVGQQPRRTAPVVRPRLERTLSVLVAEDNLVNQKLTSHLLQKLGHAVEVAASGRDAVRLYQEQPFDAILMDVQMPQMDGLEATRAIRAMEARGARHVPIIGLTAHAFQGDRDKCMEAGMDAYLTKPVSLEELGRALDRAAGG